MLRYPVGNPQNLAGIVGSAPSVLAYGAKCDGVTDDGPAVQAAVNANSAVSFPQTGSTCLINTPVTIPANRTILGSWGDGMASACNIRTTANITTFTQTGSAVSISGFHFLHQGASGSIIRSAQQSFLTAQFNAFDADNAANTNPLIYLSGGGNWLRGNHYTSLRTGGWTVEVDSTTGFINIETHIVDGFFGGTGKGILVHSSDNSARPEGLYLTGNGYVSTSINLQIEQVLLAFITNNSFDQGATNQVILKPTNTGIDTVEFTGNYFSTPNNQATGIAVFHDNSNAVALARIGFANNAFEFSGTGVQLNSNAQVVSLVGNAFNAMAVQGIDAEQAKKVTLSGNTYSSCTGNIKLVDGAAGGPFSVNGEQFDSAGTVTLTKTDPTKFYFGPTNTGKVLCGWSSTQTDTTTKPTGSFIAFPHGLAGTPDAGRIILSLNAVSAALNPIAPVLLSAVDGTNITVQVNFTVVGSGTYKVLAFASL